MLTIMIGTVAITFTLEFYNELKMLKKLADEGYKINFDTVYDINDILIPQTPKARIIYMLIPGLNLYQVGERIKAFNNKGLNELGDLDKSEYLEKMTDEEKEFYSERPSGIRAFKILKKSEENINDSEVHIYEKDDKSKLYYTIEDGEFKIVRRTGVYLKLTEEEIKKLIRDLEQKEDKEVTETKPNTNLYFERVNLDEIEQKLNNMDEEFSLKLKR